MHPAGPGLFFSARALPLTRTKKWNWNCTICVSESSKTFDRSERCSNVVEFLCLLEPVSPVRFSMIRSRPARLGHYELAEVQRHYRRGQTINTRYQPVTTFHELLSISLRSLKAVRLDHLANHCAICRYRTDRTHVQPCCVLAAIATAINITNLICNLSVTVQIKKLQARPQRVRE